MEEIRNCAGCSELVTYDPEDEGSEYCMACQVKNKLKVEEEQNKAGE